MKLLFVAAALFFHAAVYGQKNVSIRFQNDYPDVYHLSLLIYTPDGKNQTRVSNLEPGQEKTYSLPAGTEIYVANPTQEAFAMKGNDLKASGAKPTFVLAAGNKTTVVVLSSLAGR